MYTFGIRRWLFAVLLALVPLQANATAAITVNGLSSGASVQAGTPATVVASGGAGNASDWIAICNTATPAGSANCQNSWVYLQNCGSAAPGSGVTGNTCTVFVPPVTGTWYMNFLLNGGYTAQASASFTVTANTYHTEVAQSPVTNVTSTSPCVWSLPQAITAGDTVVGFVHTTIQNDAGLAYPTSVTDNLGNNYMLGTGVQWQPYPEKIGIFYLSNVPGSPTTLDIAFTNGQTNYCNVGFVEYKGNLAVSPITGPIDDFSTPTPSATIAAPGSYIWALSANNTNYGNSLLNNAPPPNYTTEIEASSNGLAVWASNAPLWNGQTLTWSNPYYNATACLDGTHSTECSALTILAAVKAPITFTNSDAIKILDATH